MASNKVYVGNLAYSVTSEELKDAFSSCGSVTDAKIMMDRETGQSRGFAFVTFSSDIEAQKAIETWHGEGLAGRSLVVNEARERENRTPGGGAPWGGRSNGHSPSNNAGAPRERRRGRDRSGGSGESW